MAIHQVPFEIPVDIQRGIDSGTLLRKGGIVRDTRGRIVKHLKEVDVDGAIPRDYLSGGLGTAGEKVKQLTGAFHGNSVAKVAVGVAVATGVVGTGIYAYLNKKKSKIVANRASAGAEIVDDKDIVVEFERAVREWACAAQKGEMTIEIIDHVVAAWNAFGLLDEEHRKAHESELSSIAEMMRAYTQRQRAVNGLPAGPYSRDEQRKFDLSEYLAQQRELFTEIK